MWLLVFLVELFMWLLFCENGEIWTHNCDHDIIVHCSTFLNYLCELQLELTSCWFHTIDQCMHVGKAWLYLLDGRESQFAYFIFFCNWFVWFASIFVEEMHIQWLHQMKRSVRQCKKVSWTFVLIFFSCVTHTHTQFCLLYTSDAADE